MKKIITQIACVFLIQTFAQTAPKGFQVSGHIAGMSKDTVLFLILNDSGDTLLSTQTKNGNFVFTGKLNTTIEWASVRIKKQEDQQWPSFFLENKKIVLNGVEKDWKLAAVLGSSETDTLQHFLSKYEFMANEFSSAIKKAQDEGMEQTKLQQMNKAGEDGLSNVVANFIQHHRNLYYTAWLIQKANFDLGWKQNQYEKLTSTVKESNFGKSLYEYIQELSVRINISPGSICPDFKLQTIDGNIISFSDVLSKHKLTLLDLWASWCKPCRELTPELKKMQQAFQDKGFTILSISSDKNLKAWKDAIAKDSMNWLHARQVQGELNPVEIFDAQAIPYFVLLDSKGRILAIDNVMSTIAPFGFEKHNTDAIYKKIEELIYSN
jgi:thiol-disulfide isomerase/thioredoxin